MQIRFISNGEPLVAEIGDSPEMTDLDDYSVVVEIDGKNDAPKTIFGMTPEDATANAIVFVKGLADEGTEIETLSESDS